MTESIQQEVTAAFADRVLQLDDDERFDLRKRRRIARLSGFRRRLRRRRGRSLDALEELIATCAELGDKVAYAHETESQIFAALELLRNRAVQVAWEVHTLAAAGYTEGAYARWRTLHEIAVVSEFLRRFVLSSRRAYAHPGACRA